MSSKDPAFLFYPKDWLEGTAEMTPEEKGVYIDLLAHQHQRGGLPVDTKRLSKMVGLSEQEFLKIWQLLKTKFNQSGDRLVNRKLEGLTTDRLSKSHTNRITGKFATLIRSISHLHKDVVETLKNEFKITDFDRLPTDQATERLAEWFHSRLKSIGNANGNTNGNEDVNAFKGGVGEKLGSTALIPQMHVVWMSTFPKYTADIKIDYPALGQISDFIFDKAGVVNGYGDTQKEILALNTFQQIADEVKKDGFWVNKPLKSIANHLQEFYNKIKNPNNGSSKQSSTNGKKFDDDRLKQKLADKHAEWQQNGR